MNYPEVFYFRMCYVIFVEKCITGYTQYFSDEF